MLDNTNFRRNVYTPAVQSLSLEPLTVHDLRHTTASLAVSAGANVKAVQKSAALPIELEARTMSGGVTPQTVSQMMQPKSGGPKMALRTVLRQTA